MKPDCLVSGNAAPRGPHMWRGIWNSVVMRATDTQEHPSQGLLTRCRFETGWGQSKNPQSPS